MEKTENELRELKKEDCNECRKGDHCQFNIFRLKTEYFEPVKILFTGDCPVIWA